MISLKAIKTTPSWQKIYFNINCILFIENKCIKYFTTYNTLKLYKDGLGGHYHEFYVTEKIPRMCFSYPIVIKRKDKGYTSASTPFHP